MIQLEKKRFDELLALNNANTPHVGELDKDSLNWRLGMTSFLKFAERDDELIGFIQGLLPNQAYTSLNYQWFEDRYSNFLYIDRIVVHEDHRKRGLAHEFYRLAIDFCRQLSISRILLEVNLTPQNPESHLFHQKLGFEAVGELEHEPGKVVQMYRLEVR